MGSGFGGSRRTDGTAIVRPVIPQQRFLFLVEAIVWRYRPCGRYVQGFVLGKLKHDPVYRALLALSCWAERGMIVDLGCGQGIVPVLLATANGLNLLPGGRGQPPSLWALERDPASAEVARIALGGAGEVVTGDASTTELPRCRVALLIDLLYHLDPAAQEALLVKVRDALEPGGSLILREADAAAGWRFAMTWLAEWLRNLARGRPFRRRYYRPAEQWKRTLQDLGFTVDARPMSEGTPFANELLIATRPE